MFSEINAVMPGFINIRLNPEYLAGYVNRMASDEKYGLEGSKGPETIIVDYGGANVAKSLHVGHPQGCSYRRALSDLPLYGDTRP